MARERSKSRSESQGPGLASLVARLTTRRKSISRSDDERPEARHGRPEPTGGAPIQIQVHRKPSSRSRSGSQSQSQSQSQPQSQPRLQSHSHSHSHSHTRPHTHTHTHTHTHSKSDRSPLRVLLCPLDVRYNQFILSIPRHSADVASLERHARQSYREARLSLSSSTVFQFYDGHGRELGEGDLIGGVGQRESERGAKGDKRDVKGAKRDKKEIKIWYRLWKQTPPSSSSPSSPPPWKFSRPSSSARSHQDTANERPLDEHLTTTLLATLPLPSTTLSTLRALIATHLRLADPLRVSLTPRDGMRRGRPLYGSHWSLAGVRSGWLCRWLSVDVLPRGVGTGKTGGSGGGYVVVRGAEGSGLEGRDWVYYPRKGDTRDKEKVEKLVRFLKRRVLRGVRRGGEDDDDNDSVSDGDGKGQEDYNTGDIRITLRGTPITHPHITLLEWGATYDFSLTSDALTDQFIRTETWLLAPAAAQCSVCIEDCTLADMPGRVTAQCGHLSTVCRGCLRTWLREGIHGGRWDRLGCPDCGEMLEWGDVRRFMGGARGGIIKKGEEDGKGKRVEDDNTDDTFTRYDTLITHALLARDDTFHFCLSPGCNSGQLHQATCSQFHCVECRANWCLQHRVPWHTGETCDQYDTRTRDEARRAADRASQRAVQKLSRPCPSCKRDVHKFEGCDHITCLCGHEWCYLCAAPYRFFNGGFLTCHHAADCPVNDPLRRVFEELNPGLDFDGQMEQLGDLGPDGVDGGLELGMDVAGDRGRGRRRRRGGHAAGAEAGVGIGTGNGTAAPATTPEDIVLDPIDGTPFAPQRLRAAGRGTVRRGRTRSRRPSLGQLPQQQQTQTENETSSSGSIPGAAPVPRAWRAHGAAAAAAAVAAASAARTPVRMNSRRAARWGEREVLVESSWWDGEGGGENGDGEGEGDDNGDGGVRV